MPPVHALFGAVLAAGLGAMVYLSGFGFPPLRPQVAEGDHDPYPNGRIGGTGSLDLLVLGTSLTARSTWPEALAETLGRSCDLEVRLHRHALPGAASDWGAAEIGRALALAGPGQLDVALVEFDANDASLFRGVTVTASVANHRTIVESIARDAPHALVYLVSMNPALGIERLERPGRPTYRAALAKLAREMEVGFIDTMPDWRALPPPELAALIPDGLHPTDEAAIRLLVPRMDAVLRRHVCP